MVFPAAKVLMPLSDTVFVALCDSGLYLYFYLFDLGKHYNSSMGFFIVWGGFF